MTLLPVLVYAATLGAFAALIAALAALVLGPGLDPVSVWILVSGSYALGAVR